jgi:hypothetical protein
MNALGFAWDPVRGANIDERSESIWNDYVLASALFNITFSPSNLNMQEHPDASQFHESGWVYYDEMSAILPSRTTGNLAFSAQMHAPISRANILSGSSGGSSPSGGHDYCMIMHHMAFRITCSQRMRCMLMPIWQTSKICTSTMAMNRMIIQPHSLCSLHHLFYTICTSFCKPSISFY